MGHSKSSVVQEVVNNTLNSSISSSITSTSQESSVETLQESAQSCSSAVEQSNSCNMSNMTIGGDFVLGGTQSNKAKVSFSCINSSTAAQEMQSSATSAISGELDALNGTEAAAILNAKAEAVSKTGSLAVGGSTKTNVSSKDVNNVSNITKSTIENLFKSNVSQHLTSKVVDECIGRTIQKNELNASGTKVAGNAKIECTQTNSLEQVQECKQLTEALNKSFAKTAQELGFTVLTESDTTIKTKMEGSAKSESVATGPIQDLGNALSSVIGSVGNLFGMASLGMAAPFVVVCCFVCSCVILSCVSSMMAAKSGGGAGGPGPSGSMGMGRGRRMRGGYSDTDGSGNSDTVEYLGTIGINILSDVLTDSSPFFE